MRVVRALKKSEVQKMERSCPNCKIKMNGHEFHHVTVEACKGCELIWFDAEDLWLLLRGDPKAITELSADLRECGATTPHCENAMCPDCKVRLELRRYMYDSPIPMLVCPVCGGFGTKKSDLQRMQRWLDVGHIESKIRHAGFLVVDIR